MICGARTVKVSGGKVREVTPPPAGLLARVLSALSPYKQPSLFARCMAAHIASATHAGRAI